MVLSLRSRARVFPVSFTWYSRCFSQLMLTLVRFFFSSDTSTPKIFGSEGVPGVEAISWMVACFPVPAGPITIRVTAPSVVTVHSFPSSRRYMTRPVYPEPRSCMVTSRTGPLSALMAFENVLEGIPLISRQMRGGEGRVKDGLKMVSAELVIAITERSPSGVSVMLSRTGDLRSFFIPGCHGSSATPQKKR